MLPVGKCPNLPNAPCPATFSPPLAPRKKKNKKQKRIASVSRNTKRPLSMEELGSSLHPVTRGLGSVMQERPCGGRTPQTCQTACRGALSC